MNRKRKDELIRQEIIDGYDRYYRLAYSYAHNENDALDIVQEGAYKAILNSDSLKQPEYLKTWLYRLMVNEALQYIKKYKKSFDSLDALDGHKEEGVQDSYEDLDLKAAVEGLEEPDQTIVKLRYFEDLQIREIAEIMEENINTIKSRLYRSIEKLRLAMK